MPWHRGNLPGCGDVVWGMKPIRDVHVAEPGLLVVDLAAADDDTAFAMQNAIARRWATAPAEHVTRQPGEPGVRLRCYVDLRQELAAPRSSAGR